MYDIVLEVLIVIIRHHSFISIYILSRFCNNLFLIRSNLEIYDLLYIYRTNRDADTVP